MFLESTDLRFCSSCELLRVTWLPKLKGMLCVESNATCLGARSGFWNRWPMWSDFKVWSRTELSVVLKWPKPIVVLHQKRVTRNDFIDNYSNNNNDNDPQIGL